MAKKATEPSKVDITGLCQDMLSKMALYLTVITVNISRNLKDFNQKYTALQPYLDHITLIDNQVAALKQAAYNMDAYLKKPEAKYKKLERL
ncbi:biogenesis of lysosome-related organelles complex 1 subunit 2-like [Trichosurus vulpecula]|uniref:biogenesis of lysosome-related organelles complex 1 subunit 2-like n=1 Tax=Trichosurus vulpecula TaxID=9337 RepID=UPI00186B42FA|nr:biogenesis of lysosome-related organelles complex 1 subunit 2-like [Trichosurus vulpecula]